MKKLTDKVISYLLIGIIITGIGLLVYPSLADYWNSFHQSQAIMKYQERVTDLDTSQYEKILADAADYNKQFLDTGIKWHMTDEEQSDYNSKLSIDDTGNMGYITIPKINVTLPIYHGTTEEVLQTSIGHLEGTSLPVGGESTHSVLSGHRGLPSSKLFSDLDKLKVGDSWTVSILNETYTYEVDQIRIVLPKDLSNIQIEEGMDYQTLLTCTPYGVNTHRLLVRGHRVANEDGNALVIADAIQIEPIYIAPFIGIPVVILLLLLFIISTNKEQRRKRLFRRQLGKRKD
ncbi:sortase [Streptococcus varani]|uniref:Sortase n=1 Tax=Streptococcus varani TaxID=1608583 RepID=A0A0E3WFD8_9STRE|nr:class C sortase [Streptococcus varani]CQR25332.1 sortase [Streptococcus varani]